MVKIFAILVSREIRINIRNSGEIILPLLFAIISTTLFPLAIHPGQQVLQSIAPGVIVVITAFASMLSLENLWREDYADGCLEQLYLSNISMILTVLAKHAAHWLCMGLPLALMSPLLAVTLGLPTSLLFLVFFCVALAILNMSLLGGIGVCITLGLSKGSLLLPILLLPLYTPTVIFSAQTVALASDGLPFQSSLLLLISLSVLILCLAPLASVAAIKMALE